MTRSDYRFFFPFRVRYSEIDGQGVVFNAHYLTYFDTAITEYFRALDYDLTAGAKATGFDFHVVRALVEIKSSLRFDQEFEVGVRVAKIGRSSLTFDFAVFGKGDEHLYATGEIVWVNTDQTSRETAPVSHSLRTMLAAWEPRLGAVARNPA